jgi:enolase
MNAVGKLAGTADEGGWWPVFASNEEALEVLTRAIEVSRRSHGKDVFISLDIAASEFFEDGRYRLARDAAEFDSATMVEQVASWARRFPILSIEDPVAQDDVAGMAQITRSLGPRVQIVGDDFLVTDATRIEAAADLGACNAALIKINQAGTLSKAFQALTAAKARSWATIVSARSGETEDVSIVHLSIGWDAGQLKVGSFARSERMAKWNELLRIEEAMGADVQFAGWTGLPPGVSREGGGLP